MVAGKNSLNNGVVQVDIDRVKGTIRSLRKVGDAYEYASGNGLNDYLYTGHITDNPQGIERIRSIKVLNDGAVAATLRIESEAPGCNLLLRNIEWEYKAHILKLQNILFIQCIANIHSVYSFVNCNIAQQKITSWSFRFYT